MKKVVTNKNQIALQTLAPSAIGYAIACLYLVGNPINHIFDQWEKIIAAGFLSVAFSLIQYLIPRPAKEFLVFWRLKERLPGFRSFSYGRKFSNIINRSEVVDIDLRQQLSPADQDRLYYKIYSKYREIGSVQNYAFRYLQWRELASFSIVMGAIGYAFVAVAVGYRSRQAMYAAAIAAFVYFLSVIAARSTANNLVDYVLLNEKISKEGAL